MPREVRRRSGVEGLLGLLTAVATLLLGVGGAYAGEVRVAVAANFMQAAREIGAAFGNATGHKAVFSFGSTGQLYTQITQDAPFEVFLAADQEHPGKAVEAGLAVADSRFTYAEGRIVLYSKDAALVKDGQTLKEGSFARIAIANPATAPYGVAAVEAMKKLGVFEMLRPKIVRGNNIAQTYQFVETGNAELGFVALSQIVKHEEGSRWIVPEDSYSTIAQDAVLLKKGKENKAATAFLKFLSSASAEAAKAKYGYGTGREPSG